MADSSSSGSVNVIRKTKMKCPHCQINDKGILVLFYDKNDKCIRCIICGFRQYELFKEVSKNGNNTKTSRRPNSNMEKI